MNNFKMSKREILQRASRGLQCENKPSKPKRSIETSIELNGFNVTLSQGVAAKRYKISTQQNICERETSPDSVSD